MIEKGARVYSSSSGSSRGGRVRMRGTLSRARKVSRRWKEADSLTPSPLEEFSLSLSHLLSQHVSPSLRTCLHKRSKGLLRVTSGVTLATEMLCYFCSCCSVPEIACE